MTTAKQLATDLHNALETRTRVNGESFLALRDGSPEWMFDVIRAAHGDMLPDDTRYSMIREVLSCLTDRDVEEWDDCDVQHEVCDSLVDVYTSRLTAWLASHIDRLGYVTSAVDEYGRGSDTEQELRMGQFAEYEEIYGALVRELTSRADDDESEG